MGYCRAPRAEAARRAGMALVLASALALLAAACGGAGPEATSTPAAPTPVPTAEATASPAPASTAEATATPAPTSPAEATATPAPASPAEATATAAPSPTSAAGATATPPPTSAAEATAAPSPAPAAEGAAAPPPAPAAEATAAPEAAPAAEATAAPEAAPAAEATAAPEAAPAAEATAAPEAAPADGDQGTANWAAFDACMEGYPRTYETRLAVLERAQQDGQVASNNWTIALAAVGGRGSDGWLFLPDLLDDAQNWRVTEQGARWDVTNRDPILAQPALTLITIRLLNAIAPGVVRRSFSTLAGGDRRIIVTAVMGVEQIAATRAAIARTASILDNYNQLRGATTDSGITLGISTDGFAQRLNYLATEIPRVRGQRDAELANWQNYCRLQAAGASGGERREVSSEPPAVRLAEAFGGVSFERPVEAGAYLGAGGGMFVAEQDGRVFALPDGGGVSLLIDLRDRVDRRGNEEGLLSLALEPGFREHGRFWVWYSPRGLAGGARATRLARFEADPAAVPPRADPASELAALELRQPYSNHNGGAIRFGPDGMLYLGVGDGGAGGDPLGHGQDRTTLFGSVIRIDVRGASADAPYAIPPGNPFAGGAEGRAELWAYGLRNPWRMAFDPATGALWAGDVGQSDREEIDVIERGANYGWNRLEGSRCFEAEACDASDTAPPAAEYGRGLGCSVTGGVVYRGEAIPALAGRYLFADFCSGRVWAMPAAGGAFAEIARSPRPVSSFGVDADGEVYLLTFGGPALRIEVAP